VNGGYNLVAVQDQPDTDLDTVTLVPADPNGKPVTLIAAAKATLAWSSDGSKLAVATLGIAPFVPAKNTFVEQQLSGIALFNTDGSPVPQPLIAAIQTDSSGPQDPVIQNNNNLIAFDIMGVTKLDTSIGVGIGVTPTQPGGQVQIVAHGEAHSPAFSPDGTHALFLASPTSVPGKDDLMVVNLTTGTMQDLTNQSGDVSSAAWSPVLTKPS
jgi:Tol biopolymer transport system component